MPSRVSLPTDGLMSVVSFRREALAEAADEAFALTARHYDEVIPYKRAHPFEIDEDRFLTLEASGLLRAYAARRDGRLIGYCIYIVTPGGLHAKNTKRATCTDWYVLPEERKRSAAGVGLIRFAERELKAEGVVIMATAVMENSGAAQVLLERMGHTLTERIYTKVLNDG